MALPVLGWAPLHRDLVDYFVPIRQLTARCLAEGSVPWLNPANGCGEAWFANPQTGVLYPPHWAYQVLPTTWALTLEVAVHLALLSLGAGLLARRWGADAPGRTAAEAAAFTAGPVVATVGVVNNLEALAWVPWMVLSASSEDRRALPATAAAVAGGWLAGEPQVWAIGVALAVVAARRRLPAIAAGVLGLALAAVQAVPFVAWVLEGDRGASSGAQALVGAVPPAAWWGVVLPGAPVAVADQMVYAESLFLGAPFLAWALLGLRRRPWAAAPVAVLALLATLPAVGGGAVYLGLTGGLLRYPGRFALVAVACLVPLVGLGYSRWRAGAGAPACLVVACLSLLGCVAAPLPGHLLLAGLPALLLLVVSFAGQRPILRDLVLAVAISASAAACVPLLGAGPWPWPPEEGPPTPWPEACSGGRLYTPPLNPDVGQWLATGLAPRTRWPVGYLNLEQGVSLTRTWGPLGHRRLAEHLELADQGAAGRWWLDSLAAGWLVLPYAEPPPRMLVVRRQGGLWLHRNLAALPEVTLAAAPPVGEAPWTGIGAVVALAPVDNGLVASTASSREGWAWISVAPVSGWRWWLDGARVEPEQGPGIVQFLAVPAGVHRLEGRYRPRGLPAAGLVTVLSGAILAAWFVRSSSRFGSGRE
jgi:hypothetical protein